MSGATWARRPDETVTEYRMRYLVKREMRVAGVSQTEMAQLLGCSRVHVNEMLSGRTRFSLNWAELMLRQLGRQIQLGVIDADVSLR